MGESHKAPYVSNDHVTMLMTQCTRLGRPKGLSPVLVLHMLRSSLTPSCGLCLGCAGQNETDWGMAATRIIKNLTAEYVPFFDFNCFPLPLMCYM